MKARILFINVLAQVAVCLPSVADDFKVTVNIGSTGPRSMTQILILKMATPEGQVNIASAQHDGNKEIVFTGKVDGSALGYLNFNDGRHGIPLILEKGDIKVAQDDHYMISASGTPLNDAYNNFWREYGERIKPAITPIEEKMKAEGLSQVERGQLNGVMMKKRAEVANMMTKEYLVKHGDDALGALLFLNNNAVKENEIEITEQLWSLLSEKVRSLKDVHDLYDRVRGYNACHEGMMMKDVAIKGGSLGGKDVKLSDFIGKGKYVFVDFWASWCSACRAELPRVRVAYANHKDKNIDFLGILIWDKRPAAERAIKAEDLPWTQIIDTEGASGRTYGVSAIPQTFLFSPEGKLLKIGLRGNELDKYLNEIFK